MYNTAIIVILYAAILESIIIIVGNVFTLFVFWKHRNSLRRTFLLVINLAVADLFVGVTEPISIGAYGISWHLEEENFHNDRNTNIGAAFQITFRFGSVLFLTLVSLERACGLIWPIRHRIASTKVYSHSAFVAWNAAILSGVLTLLTSFNILDFAYWKVGIGSANFLCLATICVSYLAIRKKLSGRVPAIDGPHNRQNGSQKNAKLSRTLFIMITASLLFWIPSLVIRSTQYLCSACVPLLLYHISTMFRLANSLVNPIIYSFRIPMFREIFKRVKLCKQSMEYEINHTP